MALPLSWARFHRERCTAILVHENVPGFNAEIIAEGLAPDYIIYKFAPQIDLRMQWTKFQAYRVSVFVTTTLDCRLVVQTVDVGFGNVAERKRQFLVCYHRRLAAWHLSMANRHM